MHFYANLYFIYFNCTEGTKTVYTIKHHTLGLVCAQETNIVIYGITEFAR